MKLKITKKIQYGLMALLMAVNIGLVFIFLQGPANSHEKFSADFDFSPIENKNLDFREINNFFTKIAEEKGGEFGYHALAFAANQNILPPNVDTHLLGHSVGDVLFKQEGIEGIKVCTDDLRNACSHSIVVGTLLENGTDILPEIVALCKEAPGGRGAYTMCVHGLGHGILAFAEYDIQKAMEICKKTGTEEFSYSEVGQCAGGMTMEMVAGVHDRVAWEKQYENTFSDDDPLAPCNKDFIPDSSKTFCYMYITPRFLQLAGADLGNPDPKYYPKAISYCNLIPQTRSADRNSCFASFGKEFAVLANNRNVQSVQSMTDEQLSKIYEWCLAGGKQSLSPCLGSALQSLYWGGENAPDVSIRYCGIIPDATESQNCMNSLISSVHYYKSQDSAAKEYFCSEVPEQYKQLCESRLLKKN